MCTSKHSLVAARSWIGWRCGWAFEDVNAVCNYSWVVLHSQPHLSRSRPIARHSCPQFSSSFSLVAGKQTRHCIIESEGIMVEDWKTPCKASVGLHLFYKRCLSVCGTATLLNSIISLLGKTINCSDATWHLETTRSDKETHESSSQQNSQGTQLYFNIWNGDVGHSSIGDASWVDDCERA